MTIMEDMMRESFKENCNVDLDNPFPRMTYAEAMHRFGSDKPDLRIPLEFIDITDLMKTVEFKVFNAPANDEESRIAMLKIPQGAKISRKEIDGYTDYVGQYGAKGLAYIKCNDVSDLKEGLQSPILKVLARRNHSATG